MSGDDQSAGRDRLPFEDAVTEALERIGSPGWERFSEQIRHTGGCSQPVRLSGTLHRADIGTGELSLAYDSASEPDGVLLKACQARRATRCPACAGVYKADARQLILAGLIGGKGVGQEVAERPLVFVTLTAPSFGAVHTEHALLVPCHADGIDCACGQSHDCQVVHSDGDKDLGTPLCPATYDYVGTIIWNNRVSELWRRTMTATKRSLARLVGLSVRSFHQCHRLAYIKVIEYQARGAVHVHGLVRLDPAPGRKLANALRETGLLVAAISHAADVIGVPNPLLGRESVRWGTQKFIEPVPVDGRSRLSSYLAKYTTKSVYEGSALDHRLKPADLALLQLGEHLNRLVKTAWALGSRSNLKECRLREWAHTLGHRGHWVTKSAGWSTTLTALREARHVFRASQAAEGPAGVAIGHWSYRGTGHRDHGDLWLAEAYSKARQLNRRIAWEEQG